MKALVVYESMFGNTKTIAELIADGMGGRLDTSIHEVGGAPSRVAEDVELLVVGGPTHAFGMTREGTRTQAAGETKGPLVSTGIGLREWLEHVQVRQGMAVATFDTALRKWSRLGTAGRSAIKRMKRLGLEPQAAPETFFVEGTTGPLADGEQARATEWGAQLALRVLDRAGKSAASK